MIIAISNHKGGVGKTTTTLNLGAALAAETGKKVLLVDLDPQANLSQSLGIIEPKESIYEALTGRGANGLRGVGKGLDVIPARLDLAGAEVELSGEPGRELILRDHLTQYTGAKGYAYILIDTPPSLGLLTLNALACADAVLIPVKAEYLPLQGLSNLQRIIQKVSARINPNIKAEAIVITSYDARKALHKTIAEKIAASFDVMRSRIRENIALAEAPIQGQTIFDYRSKSAGAEDYAALAAELAEKWKPSNKVK
jgi:chromosome partitioning protein